MDADPQLIVRWDYIARQYVSRRDLHFTIATQYQFLQAVDSIIGEVKHFVEQNGGWELLRNDDGRPKKERAAQRLILGITRHAAKANNINIAPEADIGRGPVDFQFSMGYKWRALIEVKLVSNSRFWKGLENQLPTYLKAEQARDGYLVAVAFNNEEIAKAQE